MEDLILLMEKHRGAVEETLKPFIHIEITPSDTLKPWNSKFQGKPYLPEGSAVPRGKDGKELFLAAQFNFEEMPVFDPLPSEGILQFWVDADDPHERENFKVIFHPEVRKTDLRSDVSMALPANNPVFRKPSLEYRLTFDLRKMPMTHYITGFDTVFEAASDELESAGYEFTDAYEEYVHTRFRYDDGEFYSDNGHRIGGYPAWIHADYSPKDKDFLLFQMDADYETENIVWGDWGVAFWFISTDALRRRDFSDIHFTYDTS